MIYLDYNATAPLKPAVRTAMMEALERFGNPSSVHRFGRTARRHCEEARAALAALAGVKPAQVIFTSGGTEANTTVFQGLSGFNFVTSSIEHDSVLANTPGALRIPVTAEGAVDLWAAEKMIKAAQKRTLISLMMVNNETGAIQPVADVARLAKSYGHLVHCDAVQGAGRLPIDFAALGADFLTLSAHKIGGPQGAGALILGEKMTLAPLIKGGGQEMNRRAGTENVAGIVGFGVAAQLAADDLRDVPRITALRDQLQKRLLGIAGEDAAVLSANGPRTGNTLCIAMKNVPSETQVMSMDLASVAVSSGAACSSGKVKASHVLRAMGYPDAVASCALRFSLGWNTEARDIAAAAEAWRQLYERTHNKQRKAA